VPVVVLDSRGQLHPGGPYPAVIRAHINDTKIQNYPENTKRFRHFFHKKIRTAGRRRVFAEHLAGIPK
jgi:hypothetical protein